MNSLSLFQSYVHAQKKLELQEIIKYTEVNWENEHIQEEWFFCTKEFLRNIIKVEPQRMQGLTRLINQEEEGFVSIFKKFLARTLYLIIDYLPLNHQIIDTLDLFTGKIEFKENLFNRDVYTKPYTSSVRN